jgi:hypothetical protein
VQGVPQVVGYDADSGRPWAGNRLAAGAQDGVTQLPGSVYRHAPNLLLLRLAGERTWG